MSSLAQVIVLIRAGSSDIMSVSPTARPAMVGSYGGYGQLLDPTNLAKVRVRETRIEIERFCSF